MQVLDLCVDSSHDSPRLLCIFRTDQGSQTCILRQIWFKFSLIISFFASILDILIWMIKFWTLDRLFSNCFFYQNLTQQQEFKRQGVEFKSASFVIGFFDLAILWICDYGGVPASAFFFTNRLSVYSEKLTSRSLKTKLEFSVSFGWAGVIVQ